MKTLQVGRAAQRTLPADLNANFSELANDFLVVPLDATVANTTFVVPAGYRVMHVAVQNTTANAVTGGLNIGTAANGAQVLSALAVGANALVSANPILSIFSTTADTTLYLSAATAWNNASVNVRVMLGKTF